MVWLTSYHLAGFMGLVVYIPLISYVFYQIMSVIYKNSFKMKYFNYKFSFHLIFFIASFFECIYCSSMIIMNHVVVWGYCFRIFALLLTVIYFSMIVNLWGYTLDYRNTFQKFYIIGTIAIGTNAIASGVGLYYLGLSRGYKQYSETIGFILILFTHSLSLLFFSLYLLLYGHLIKYKITQPSVSSVDASSNNITRILLILQRINFIMTICTLCYSFRISVMFLKVYSLIFDKDHLVPKLTPPTWILFTDLLPTLLPNISFLYVMKITDIPTLPSDGEPSTLPSYHNRSWYYQDDETFSHSERESSLSRNLLTAELRGSMNVERSR